MCVLSAYSLLSAVLGMHIQQEWCEKILLCAEPYRDHGLSINYQTREFWDRESWWQREVSSHVGEVGGQGARSKQRGRPI